VYTTGRPATYPDSKYILNDRPLLGILSAMPTVFRIITG
jgi:hypothetical protein